MFVIVEVIFKGASPISYPTVIGTPLFELCWIFDRSDRVVAFRVIDGNPVHPNNYGWGEFDKWVMKFEPEHFRS